MIDGYETIGYDAVNVGGYDLAAGYTFLKSIADSTSIPFLSANLLDKESGDHVFDPYIIIDRPPFKIGVVGVTNLLPPNVTEIAMEDYLSTGKTLIKELKEKTHLVIMLVNADKKDKGKVIQEFADADYIFISRDTQKTHRTQAQATGPIIYSPGKQGKYLAVIDLNIVHLDSPFVDVSFYKKQIKSAENRIANFQKKDPDKSLEDIYINQPNILRNIDVLNQQIKSANIQLTSGVNQSEFKLVSMNKKIGDDLDMLAFVDVVFKKENEIKGLPNLPPGKKLKSPIRSLP